MSNLFSAFLHQIERGDVVLVAAVALLVACSVHRVLHLGGLLGNKCRVQRLANLAWQMGCLLGLEQAYEFTRGRISYEKDITDIALLHAYRLLDLEWRHGFFVESRIERFFLHFRVVMNAVDLFYVLAHVGVTIGVLVYLYLRRQQHFWLVRNLLMVTTAIALVAFYVYPMAPPRFLPNYGFVDPSVLHHFVAAGGAQIDSYTYNPYAAMPSLHVAYALVVGWGLVLAERRRLIRTAAAVYPLVMAAVVVISGNHWLLDVAGAFVTVALAAGVIRLVGTVQMYVRRCSPFNPWLARLAHCGQK